MNELITAACSLGVGAFLGVVIFIMYVRDRRDSEEKLRQDRVFMEDRLDKIIERDQVTRESNTKALTELTTVLERMNGRHNG